MDIDNYLQIMNLSKDEYKIIRFKEYKKKYGFELQNHEFENMLRYVPENCMDDQYYHKYIKKCKIHEIFK